MFKEEIITRVKFNGGFTNCHAHLDRALTINAQNFTQSQLPLQQKWDIVRELKINSTVDGLAYRMCKILDNQIEQGVTSLLTFLDFDEYSEDKPYKAFQIVDNLYGDKIRLYCANQTLQGLEDEKSLYWFNYGASICDVIGSLPGRDKDKSKHLDIVFDKAKDLHRWRTKKTKIHVHVDQFSDPNEKETELVLDKIEEYGLNGQVTLIHCLSLACQSKEYRIKQYERMVETQTSVIACPTAWLDSKRSEVIVPFHNSTTPVDEMIEYGVCVGVGTDNISDLMVPLSTGDMYREIELLAITNRLYDMNNLVKIASTNGKKILSKEVV